MTQSTGSDFICKRCGREVHPNARACPNCGTRRGNRTTAVPAWHQAEHLDGIDLPSARSGDDDDDDFDYDAFVAREFGSSHSATGAESKRDWKKTMWWLTALITLLAFILLVMRF